MIIDTIMSALTTIGGLIVERLKSEDNVDKKIIDRTASKIECCDIQENKFKATPELIGALKNERNNDDIKFDLLLISIMENS